MRRFAVALATTAALVAVPALAKDGAVYVGGEFGAMKANDADIDVGGVDNVISVEHEFDWPWDGLGETGWDGSVFLGYDFGGFRLEGEASRKSADIERYTSTIAFPGGAPAGTRLAVGDTDVSSFMLNAMGDFGDDEGTSFFVGGGVGYAKVKFDDFGAFSNQAAALDDTDNGWAWQLFAGVRQAISDNVDVHIKYRYFNAPGVDLVAFNGAQAETSFSSHSLLGGISFNFGGSPPPPPPPVSRPVAVPPPAPTPPPPPQMQTCWNNTRIPVTQACPPPPAPPPAPRAGENG